jgi:hypothetical protein
MMRTGADSAEALLSLWERAAAVSGPRRALVLLRAAAPHAAEDQLSLWPLGRRDATLIEWRQRLFGPHLALTDSCPSCAERIEVDLDLRDLAAERSHEASRTMVQAEGYRIAIRPLATLDLIDVQDEPDPAAGATMLLERCVVEAHAPDGREVHAFSLPATIVAAVEERAAEADPLAEITLALGCPACARPWQGVFSIVDQVWDDLEAFVRETLGEVATLAAVFGWNERDILQLSPSRRAAYLQWARGV